MCVYVYVIVLWTSLLHHLAGGWEGSGEWPCQNLPSNKEFLRERLPVGEIYRCRCGSKMVADLTPGRRGAWQI